MSGSVINKTVIRREIIHINRIYSETASRKKLILLVSDNSGGLFRYTAIMKREMPCFS